MDRKELLKTIAPIAAALGVGYYVGYNSKIEKLAMKSKARKATTHSSVLETLEKWFEDAHDPRTAEEIVSDWLANHAFHDIVNGE